MLFYIKIGFRNLVKNYRRSIKTILTIVIGLSACLLAQGFISHTLWGLKESLINGGLGHIQIYEKGYLQHQTDEPYRYLITNQNTVLRELSNIPGVKLKAPHLNFQGIVSSGERSTIFNGTAGLPQQEKILNSLVTLKEGSFLMDDNPFGVLIGSGIARKLNVGVGDAVTIMSTLKDGAINALDFEIAGIIEVQIKAYNDVVLLANLETIQGFIDTPHSVDRIVLLFTKTKYFEATKPSIDKICNKLGLEYRDWQLLAGKQYTQPKLFYDLIYLLIMTIIVLVVIFSIINTLNLSMLERVREVGTIRSLGTTRFQVGMIFISESFLIGLFGGILGIVVGYGLSWFFNSLGGISIPPPPGQARGYIAYFEPDFIQAIWLWIVFLITATVAGFYPAFRVARFQVVEALRWI